MQDFFKSKKFLVVVLLVSIALFFMLRGAYTGTGVTFAEKVTSFVTYPFQKAFSKVYVSIHDSFYDFIHAPSISDENERLRAENAELLAKTARMEKLESENRRMKEFFGIKQENPDYSMELSDVIGRDASERFYSFTIDKGTRDGIEKYSPCVTKEGLVGLVTSVGPNYAKVSTILDSTCEVGAKVLESGDIAVTEGTALLALEGNLRLSYLPRDSKTKVGDLVTTTGIGGIFPEGLVVGKIKEVTPDSQGLTLYAVIEPLMDIRNVTEVMIIKDFEGKEKKVD